MNTNYKMREYIDLIKTLEESNNETLEEGFFNKLLLAVAAVAALAGYNKLETENLLKTNPQLVELGKLKIEAENNRDEEKVKELDKRIEDTLNFIREKGRPVLDKHGNPIVPRYNKDN